MNMKWWMLAVLVIAAVSMADAGETDESRVIRLQLKSEARVPALALEEARAEVVRIFADAGIAVRWTDIAPPGALDGEPFGLDAALALLHVRDGSGALRIGLDAHLLLWARLPGWRVLARTLKKSDFPQAIFANPALVTLVTSASCP